jgi:hypothetical protein
MKKFLSAFLITVSLALTLISVVASASDLGMGAECIAEEVKIVKTGLIGRKIAFSDADIKQGLCLSDFKSITITALPKSTDGTLMLAGRRISEGCVIKRKDLPSLVFIPSGKDITETSFKFKVDGYAAGAELDFILKFTDKVNYEPEIREVDSLTVSTQREIGYFGKLTASDAEGDRLEFIVVSYPKHGTLSSFDKDSGEYVYTPRASYTGEDKFVYTVRDEWGNFSKTATVNVTVKERMSEVRYVDMTDRAEYGAAVAMTAMGIMGGRIIGDGSYFSPDESVTKAEFVAMAMKVMGIRADSSLTESYFDDNEDIPAPLLGYVATAQRLGYITGEFKDGELVFCPNDKITKYEAAVVMANIIGRSFDGEITVFSDEKDIPAWARASVYTMCAAGVFSQNGGAIGATATVTRADAAAYLYSMASLK